jgi:hypothetical protein
MRPYVRAMSMPTAMQRGRATGVEDGGDGAEAGQGQTRVAAAGVQGREQVAW